MNEVEHGGVVEAEEIDDEEEIDDKNLYTRLDASSSNSCKRTWSKIKADHTDISSLIYPTKYFKMDYLIGKMKVAILVRIQM